MFRRLTLQTTLALAIVATLGACSTPASAPNTVGGVVAKTKNLSTFNQLVADAGMAATLNGSGPTRFSPPAMQPSRRFLRRRVTPSRATRNS